MDKYRVIKIGDYLVKYENDVGPRDESFYEWWKVEYSRTSETICKCDKIENAIAIATSLSVYLKP